MSRKWIKFMAILSLCGCGGTKSYQSVDQFYEKKKIPVPGLTAFPFCSKYGCKSVETMALDESEWQLIYQTYGPIAQSAEDERQKIAQTIGQFERIIGEKTGTDQDVYGTFRKIGKGQLDCVDESTNTTTYLSLLNQKGLLKYHKIQKPNTRIPLIHSGHWPHTTAVIMEQDSQTAFAVDSWFHDNGYPAEIVTLKEWKEGWKPRQHLRKGSDL